MGANFTKIQEAFLNKLHDADFSPARAYMLASNGCNSTTARTNTSKLLRIDYMRDAIIQLIENNINNLTVEKRVRANRLYSKMLELAITA